MLYWIKCCLSVHWQWNWAASSCSCSVAQSCPTHCDLMDCSTPGFPVFHYLWSLLKFMSIESVMLSNHLILCCTLLLLPSIFPIIKVFSNESALHISWLKYWSFSISPSNEYFRVDFLRIDWFYLFAVQETLKSLLQHHNSNASIFWCSVSLWPNSHIHTWLLEKP